MIDDLINKAIEILKRFEPREGYFLAFSGGKDSIACHQLLELSGCKYESHYSITTVDEPFVKPFIRKNYPFVIFDRPAMSMFQLIVKKGILPCRISRFCCQFLKEYSGKGRMVITGIRRAESNNRNKRRVFEIDARAKLMKGKAYLNIIADWTENDVWDLIKKYRLIVPDYYANDCRSARGGCVGCPLSGTKTQRKDFEKYPRYKYAYLKAIKKAKDKGFFKQFNNENEVLEWWLSDLSIRNYFESKQQTVLYFKN